MNEYQIRVGCDNGNVLEIGVIHAVNTDEAFVKGKDKYKTDARNKGEVLGGERTVMVKLKDDPNLDNVVEYDYRKGGLREADPMEETVHISLNLECEKCGSQELHDVDGTLTCKTCGSSDLKVKVVKAA